MHVPEAIVFLLVEGKVKQTGGFGVDSTPLTSAQVKDIVVGGVVVVDVLVVVVKATVVVVSGVVVVSNAVVVSGAVVVSVVAVV